MYLYISIFLCLYCYLSITVSLYLYLWHYLSLSLSLSLSFCLSYHLYFSVTGSSSSKSGGLETQEELIFQFESECKKRLIAQLRQSGRWRSLLPSLLLHSGLQLIRRGPPTFGRVICFTQPAASNVLVQKHPQTYPEALTKHLGISWPSQVDT